jgi:hypothetical protein
MIRPGAVREFQFIECTEFVGQVNLSGGPGDGVMSDNPALRRGRRPDTIL